MPETPPPPDFLSLHAKLQPDKPAVIDDRPDGTRIVRTYAELEAEANRLANVLLDLNVRPGHSVVWCGHNSLGVVRMIHAARKIRATAVPLNYRLTPEEAAYVVDNCDAVLIYVDAEHAGLFSKVREAIPKVRHVVVFDGSPDGETLDGDALVARASETEPVIEGGPVEGATMTYTSGTTGYPKGALRRGAGDPEQTAALLAVIGYRPDDVYLTTGPLYHSGPGGFYAVAYVLGNTAVLQRRFDAEDWLRLVDRYRVTTTFSAPTPIRMVCHLPAEVKVRYDRTSMRVMLANAAPWSFALKEMYCRDFPPESLWEIYGSTELGVNTLLRPEDQLRKPHSCGREAPGVEIKLLDEERNEVTEVGVPGEVFIRSKSVFAAYYKDPDKYESSRVGDFFSVGDVAYRDEEGFYYICDRKSDMIISGGVNIYPAEIEHALEHHPEVVDVAVFGIPDEKWGESVHAVIVARPGGELTEEGIVSFAREHLAGYKVPRSVSFIEEIPRTGSGKILKRVLREPFWAGQAARVRSGP